MRQRFVVFRSFFPPLEAEAGGIIGNECLAPAAAASWFHKNSSQQELFSISHINPKSVFHRTHVKQTKTNHPLTIWVLAQNGRRLANIK